MLISNQEWSRSNSDIDMPDAQVPTPSRHDQPGSVQMDRLARIGLKSSGADLQKAAQPPLSALYNRLSVASPDVKTKAEAALFLRQHLSGLEASRAQRGDCPETPEDLAIWMENGAQLATAKFQAYLDTRKKGAPRSYFTSRAHALYVLRALAPTKLVDGAWLYGLIRYWENPRYADLIRTYLEELGDGQADKNHVVLYRSLLARYGLDISNTLPDETYVQGTLQLALAWNAEDFLPEILGFNLGYEQLPLHLLITSYELNELGIDPYYFTLHVTVDNPQTGHALRAVRAVQEALPRLRHDDDFWRRVQRGCRLSGVGAGTTDIIQNFDIQQEAMRIFVSKGEAGRGMHSDYCRVEGRTINDWLGAADDVPELIVAMIKKGWICPGEPPEKSRFWKLLQGPTAEMFGVFSPYELQVIHDWIRGEDSADGAPYSKDDQETNAAPSRQPSFRAQKVIEERRQNAFEAKELAANAETFQSGSSVGIELLDPDLELIADVLPELDKREQTDLLVTAMSPSEHWTPAGLYATRKFAARM